PFRRFFRRVRTIVLAPRAVGVAKNTSRTLKGCPSTSINIFFFSSFAPISAIFLFYRVCPQCIRGRCSKGFEHHFQGGKSLLWTFRSPFSRNSRNPKKLNAFAAASGTS